MQPQTGHFWFFNHTQLYLRTVLQHPSSTPPWRKDTDYLVRLAQYHLRNFKSRHIFWPSNMNFWMRSTTVIALLMLQIYSTLCFTPTSVMPTGVSVSFGTRILRAQRTISILGTKMQARDPNQVRRDGAKLGTATLDRRAGARPQISTKASAPGSIVTNKNKAKLAAFERRIADTHRLPLSPPQLEMSEAQAKLERVKQLSAVLAQYSRLLSKMCLKMVSCPSLLDDSALPLSALSESDHHFFRRIRARGLHYSPSMNNYSSSMQRARKS